MYYYIENGQLIKTDDRNQIVGIKRYVHDERKVFSHYFELYYDDVKYELTNYGGWYEYLILFNQKDILMKFRYKNEDMSKLCFEIINIRMHPDGDELLFDLIENAFSKMEKLSAFIKHIYNQTLESAPNLNSNCKSAKN